MIQRLPFHRSASVRRTPDPATNCPTPVHAEPDGHDTPLRALAAAPAGFGVDWIVHTPPLRRSASVTPSPDSRTCKPTAVHAEVVEQDTALSAPFAARGFGLGMTDHPGPGALADAAGPTFACAAAPAAGPISTTAAPVATTPRRIRPRIANPHRCPGKFLAGAGNRGQARAATPSPRGSVARKPRMTRPLRPKGGTQVRRRSTLHLQV